MPAVARAYRDAGIRWVVIGDENYGEGSAREHAAMQPRYLGGVAIVCRSFARIHETNLKKQGMLPLTFEHRDDYDRVPTDAWVDIVGMAEDGGLSPSSRLRLRVHPADGGAVFELPLRHTLSEDQVEWIKAGSALNHVAQQAAATGA